MSVGSDQTSSPPAAAERRQISVIFCDLVNSSTLSERIDPEDLREFLQSYQACTEQVVRRFDGYVAQHLGDGILVYFGYPTTHEDSVKRAVLASRALLQTFTEQYSTLLIGGMVPQLRIGIHTGVVVVGDMGSAERAVCLAVGEAPNVAARVQAFALPNTAVVSEATYRLTKGYFVFRALGSVTLKGFSQQTSLYEVLGETSARDRLDAAGSEQLTQFVGRETELGHLEEGWQRARLRGAVHVHVRGEAGIGKSRLIRALRGAMPAGTLTIEGFWSPLFQSTALHPIAEALERHLRSRRDAPAAERLEALTQELVRVDLDQAGSLPLLAALLGIPPHDSEPATVGPARRNERETTFAALCAWLGKCASQAPCLFVLEDVHWADASTLEFVTELIDAAPPGLMLVLTSRSEPNAGWLERGLSALELARLPHADAERIVSSIATAQALSDATLREVIARADGVPLYLEEITKAVVEAAAARTLDRPVTISSIPASLQDSLMARLDRLVSSKPVVQIAASLGRVFRVDVLRAVTQLDDEALRVELDILQAAGILLRGENPGAQTYQFKHALIQDAAYASLLRSTRQHYHARIAQTLAEDFPQLARAEPERLAQHYENADLPLQSSQQWALAGARAIVRCAYAEGIRAYHKALAQLGKLPEARQRDDTEISIRTALGVALISTLGHSAQEVEDNYTRAYALCSDTERIPAGVLYGLYSVYLIRSDLQGTGRLVATFEALIRTNADPLLALIANSSLGVRCFLLGEYARAQDLLSRAMALRSSGLVQEATELAAVGFDGQLIPYLYSAWCLMRRGQVAAAWALWREVLLAVEAREHPYGIAVVLSLGCAMARDARDPQLARQLGTRGVTICKEHGFSAWLAVMGAHVGWSDALLRDVEGGTRRVEQCLGAMRAHGSLVVYSNHVLSLVEAYMSEGELAQAAATIDDALAFGEGKLACYQVPSLLTLRGAILVAQREYEQAELQLTHALSLLRGHGAKLLELRVVSVLVQLLAETGRIEHARTLLAEACAYFDRDCSLPLLAAARTQLSRLERDASAA
jgi:class 3 adenylate cyclase/tetratricopeptide (TPR) repeat protein